MINGNISIASARRTKTTGFGEGNRLKVGTLVSKDSNWILSDATAHDLSSGLEWIRAPWGMTFSNGTFSGEVIPIDWRLATSLFGRGAAVTYERTHTSKFLDAQLEDGYQRGRCVISFDGKSDWRLPTAHELNTLAHHKYEKLCDVFPNVVEKCVWSANRIINDSSGLLGLLQGLDYLFSDMGITKKPSGMAWRFILSPIDMHDSMDALDMQCREPYHLLFVRNVTQTR